MILNFIIQRSQLLSYDLVIPDTVRSAIFNQLFQ